MLTSRARALWFWNTSENDKGVLVAVLIEDVFPAAITIELLDALADEVDVDARLPPGLFMHLHYEKAGCAHGIDVWDSIEAHQRYVESTLMPALSKLAAARGIDLSRLGEPEMTITEIHRLVR